MPFSRGKQVLCIKQPKNKKQKTKNKKQKSNKNK